jgi:hypothetical protein
MKCNLATDINQMHTDKSNLKFQIPEFICVHLIYICG